ncbi:MAG: ATP-binding protein, partial [Dehalococcoidales bacterium]|nr:ATP-binding protein [Dehalococcoidales bacterium]
GVGCFLVGGITDILSIFFSLPVPPLGLLGNILFTFLASVALLKYHLLDLRLVLRKGAAYLLTSAIIALPYVSIIILIGRVLTDRALSTWVYFFVLLILALVLQPLWQWAQQMIDRLFYRERYDHLKALDHFSHEAQGITDLEQLGSTLVKLISESLQSDNAYLLVPSPSGEDFITTATYQVKPAAPPPSVSLPNRSSLIQWLRRNDGFVSSQDLDINAQLQTLPATDRQTLQAIGAQLYIPIKTRDKELVGVLILGVKRSQQFYSIEDKQILAPIVSQVAMSLDNARLFQEAKDAYEQWKATQEYLARSEKLRALGEMSSGIAHDFNNMLTGILGRAQLALDQVQDPKVERHLKLIEQATLDAARIVRRLQDFTRVRSDHSTSVVQLNQIANDALEMVKPRLNERGETQDVAIEASLHLGKIGPVRGDSTELREALVNILINAVEAMPHGGKLTISTRQDNNSAIVAISDTGIGMTSEVMKRMFEPFFTTKEQQGLGMGLSLVYGIVKRHGGDITVSSEPQKGSTFNVILPIAAESSEVVAPPVPQSSPGHSDILVIDDNAEARNVLSEVLIMSGHSVDTAASGEEGLSLFEQNNYDLVDTDLGM